MANNTGNPIGSTAAKDLSDNAESLDKLLNGEAYEYTDRLGRERKSLQWMEDAALAIPAIDAALRSEQQAERSESEATRSKSEANRSGYAKSEAEAARDAAHLSAGVYADIAAGLVNTASGKFFSVPSTDSSEYLILYKNNAGTATEVKRYPSAAVVQQVSDSALRLDYDITRLTDSSPSAINLPIEVGTYNNTDGSKISTTPTTWTMRMVGAFYVRAGDTLSVDPTYLFSVFYYDTDDLVSLVKANGVWETSHVISRDGYIRLSTKRVDQNLAIRTEKTLAWVYIFLKTVKLIRESALPALKGSMIEEGTVPYSALKAFSTTLSNFPFVRGTISSTSGSNQAASGSTTRTDYLPVKAGDVLSLTDPAYLYSPFWYHTASVEGFYAASGLWHSSSLEAPQDGFVRLTSKRADGGAEILDQPNIAWVSLAQKSDPLVTAPGMVASAVINPEHLSQSSLDLINGGSSRWEGQTWLSLGDSITARSWYQPLVCEITGLNFVNYGIGGTTLARKTTSDTTAMSVRYTSMQAEADIITVWGGVNDFGYSYGQVGGNTLGVMGDTSIDTVYGALDTLIKGLITKYPGKKVGFIITPPVSNAMGMRSANAKGKTLAQYCQAVRDVCEWYSIPYLDLHKVSGISEGNVNIMTSNVGGTAPDGLHPSMQAFEFMKYRLADFIKSI